MASFTDLVSLTTPATGDIIAIVDVSDSTQSPQGSTKQMTLSNLFVRGSVTTSQPFISATQTWNAGGVTFTAIAMNITDTASAAGSMLVDLAVGGSTKFSVSKTGAIIGTASATLTTFLQIGATNGFIWNGRSVMNSTADGVVQMTNNAGTGFTRLVFGTNDASGVSLVKSTTTLKVRLGADSADADLTCAALTATGLLQTTLTTQQLSLRYDPSNHLAVTVASNGAVTFNATGAGAAFTFSDAATFSSDVTVVGLVVIDDNLQFTGNRTILYPTGGSLQFVNDTAGATPILMNDTSVTIGSGGNLTLITGATTNTRAGLRLPHGTVPGTPVDGDLWTTTAGLFVRVNGVTVGPLS